MYHGFSEEDRQILDALIEKTGKIDDVKGMCIWGAFLDEVPGIHLGHLHIMNRLFDLEKNGIQVSICINEEPVLDTANTDLQNLVKRQASTTAFVLHALSDLTNHENLQVVVGTEVTERLRSDRRDEFAKVQQNLDKARIETLDAFATLRAEGPSVSEGMIEGLRPQVCESLELGEDAFHDLLELCVVRNKAHANTVWASYFGATIHLMKNRPSFLLVGRRHGYIWALYDCMFRRAGYEPIPVIRVEDFMDCVGSGPMNSRDPENCVGLDDSADIMKVKFLKGTHLAHSATRFALRDAFDKLVFAKSETVTIQGRECSSYQDVLNVGEGAIEIAVDFAVDFLKKEYWVVARFLTSVLLTDSPRRTTLEVNNFQILNYLTKGLRTTEGLRIAEKVSKIDESRVNRSPQSYRAIYDRVLEKVILGSVLDPTIIYGEINGELANKRAVLEAFDKVKSLVLATRDMDILPYQIVKRHRDHYYHQINVGGLGAVLLDTLCPGRVPLWRHIANSLDIEGEAGVKERKVKAIWWIAALLHDHAYALGHAITFLPNLLALGEHAAQPSVVKAAFNAHQKLLRPMMTDDTAMQVFEPLYSGNFDEARHGLETLVGEWIGRMPELEPAGIGVGDLRQMGDNHGVLGAVNLLSHVSAMGLSGEWRRAFRAIAAAIFTHHLHLPKKPPPIIRFDERPLSFLLAFVDEIQEWSRLLVHRGKLEACLDTIEIGPFLIRPEQPLVRQFDERLEVVFPFNDEAMLREIGWDRERFHKDKFSGLGRLVPPLPDSDSFPPKITWREEYVSEGRPE